MRGRKRDRHAGGGKGDRNQRRDFGKRSKRDDVWTDFRGRNVTWETVAGQHEGCLSEEFEEYYRTQAICPDEEWTDMVRCLETPLPITFRINGSGKFATELRTRLEEDFLSKLVPEDLEMDGKPVPPPSPMQWYPGRLAWHMNFSRTQLRKVGMLSELHEFIKRETDAGNLTRQEAVSMVPPLLLDVQPHHKVFDVCAAPGSKTFQILELLHAGPEAASGFVLANDVDVKRCNLLAHQTKRMCSPCLVVTIHDGCQFPLVRPRGAAKQRVHGTVKFDRILADVPCSGDGTLRKAPDIWRRWNVSNGNVLHGMQLRLAMHCCRLLKVGGRMVYSTCSFNPVENEAVVAALLRSTGGAVQLLDMSAALPGLKRIPGLQTWKVRHKSTWLDAWPDVAAKGFQSTKLLESMFVQADTADMPLQHCMRFLPHHQDTGGFFVAVLEKVSELQRTKDAPNKGPGDRGAAPADEKASADAGAGEVGGPASGNVADGSACSEGRAAGEGAAADGAPGVGNVRTQDGACGIQAAACAPGTGNGDAAMSAGADGADGGLNGDAGGGDPEGQQAAAGSVSTDLVWGLRGGGGRGRASGGRRSQHKGLDPVVPITDDNLLDPVVDFYGLGEAFPLKTHLISRCLDSVDRPKRCYFISDAVRRFLMMDEGEALKVTSTGIKLLERQEVKDGSNPCIFRISQEGLPFVLPHITKQRLRLPLNEVKTLLALRALRIPRTVPYTTVRPPRAPTEAAPAEPAAPTVKEEEGAEPPERQQQDAALKVKEEEDAAPKVKEEEDAEPPERQHQDAALKVKQEEGAEPPERQHQDAAPKVKEEEEDAEPAAPAPDGFAKTLTGEPPPLIETESTQQQLADVRAGCCIVTLLDADAQRLGLPTEEVDRGGGLTTDAPLALSCWRTKSTVNVLVSKQDCELILDRIQHMEVTARAAGADAA